MPLINSATSNKVEICLLTVTQFSITTIDSSILSIKMVILIILNSLFVYLAGFLDSQNPINISSTIPKTIEVGQEAQIEFKISKNSLSDFN